MGLLTPLYLLGIAGIALPIIFHLMKRTPRGRQVFSSLMFLRNSPPRLTKRSRITQWLLLLLRAAAFALLALAFARPFLAGGAAFDLLSGAPKRMAILVDISASMRRPGLWEQAGRELDAALAEAGPSDDVSLSVFDTAVHPVVTFEQWREAGDLGLRRAVMKVRFSSIRPNQAGTRLGDAVAAGAEIVSAPEAGIKNEGKVARQVVLISDIQEGGHLDALQGHPWPKDVKLEVRPVKSANSQANAGLAWMAGPAGADENATRPAAALTDKVRVRVTNAGDGAGEQFALAWADGPATQPAALFAPAGRSVVTPVAREKTPDGRDAEKLVLSGDGADFDNTLWIAPPQREVLKIAYLGVDSPQDANGLRYYLEAALGSNPRRTLQIAPDTTGGARVVVVTRPLTAAETQGLRQFVEDGGNALLVMKDAPTGIAAADLAGVRDVKEAPVAQNAYALLARVDMQDPLFAPFAEARFADFTKIHFWHHRTLTIPAGDNGIHVAAWFDDGAPFLIERSLGKGRITLLTAGWQPADSQLALSTKFVPLLEELAGANSGGQAGQFEVGDMVPADPGSTVTGPDGRKITITPDRTGFLADLPGTYRLAGPSGTERTVAVNLSPDESRTQPVDVGSFERFGAILGTAVPTAEDVKQERRLRLTELENRQKLWRWLLVGVLGLLALETLLAGRLSRRAGARAGGGATEAAA